MNIKIILFLVFLGVLILSVPVIIVLLFYDSLIKSEEQVKEAWVGVKGVYQRRLDLIPDLLEVVKNYAGSEEKTLQNVTYTREKARKMTESIDRPVLSKEAKLNEFVELHDKLVSAIKVLWVLPTKYPDLKNDVPFFTIRQELDEIENIIPLKIREYNKEVKNNSLKIRSFPSNLIAWVFKFKEKSHIKVKEKESEA
ncbi:LemA family protein [bacterium]|nr:LemA family protein [bacterium]